MPTGRRLTLAAVALRPVLLVALGYLLLMLACPFLVASASAQTRRIGLVVAAAVAGLALNAPAWSFGWHIATVVADVQSALWVPKPDRSASKPAPPMSEPSSLLLIFAESLEATYSRTDLFGEDLTPRLTALAASGRQFTDMRQVSLTAWSTGAMAAAQCARPLSADGQWRGLLQNLPAWQGLLQNIALGVSPEMRGATCLGDLLAAHGYRNVLMLGTAIHFGGIDAFHAEHGFGERLGFEVLKREANAAAQRQWGRYGQHWMIQDETLFALARAKIDELTQAAEPFALVVSTMDTHGPSGFPSPRCGKASGLIEAVRCADRLIAEFVEDVRDTHPDLVVALLTDHLTGGGSEEEVLGVLVPHAEERRLRFAVWGPNVAPGVIDRPGTHFDVLPTLMDFLGLSSWTEHYLGASLLRFDSPWFRHESPLSLRVVHELPNIQLRPGDSVSFEPGPVITLAGHRFLATSKGLSLRDAVFAIRLDHDGAAAGFRTFGDASAETVYNELMHWAAGGPLVGVSTHRTFNRQALEASTQARQPSSSWQGADLPAFFIGVHGMEDFVVGPLRARHTVELPRWHAR